MLGERRGGRRPIEADLRAALVDGLGLKPKVAFGPLRTAVSGRRVSPPLFESMEILGKASTLARLAALRAPSEGPLTTALGPRLADLGVEAVLLDADDTLYDTRSAMHVAGAAAATALWPGGRPRAARRAPACGSGTTRRVTSSAYARGEIEFDEMRRARLAELAAGSTGAPTTVTGGRPSRTPTSRPSSPR